MSLKFMQKKKENAGLPAFYPFPDNVSFAGSLKMFSAFFKTYLIILMPIKLYSASVLNPFPNKPRFLRVCSTGLLKTLWE